MRTTLFSFFLSLQLVAQNNRSLLYGTISDDLGPLLNVHIINLQTQKATNSNETGTFRIYARPNDNIQISSVGYKTQTIIVKISDFGMSGKTIRLNKEIIELDEVELKKHNLTGTLASDVKQVKYKKEINAKSLGLPNAGRRKLTQAERRLYTAYGGNLLNIDVLINLLSGRIKKLKHLKKLEDKTNTESYIKNTFTTYFVNDLKIDSTNVYRFIEYCEGDTNYYSEQDKGEFSLIDFFKSKAIEFKKLNEKP